MNSNDIIDCLGKAQDAPDVRRLLTAVGVTKPLKMPKDDIEARADLPKLGLSLIFKPMATSTRTNKETSRKKSGNSIAQANKAPPSLILQAVQFFSAAEPGYTSFSSALPQRLVVTDTQAEVRAKLGKPTESKVLLRLDRWKARDRITTVEYTKGEKRISAITVHVPVG